MEEIIEPIVDTVDVALGWTRKQELVALGVVSQVCLWGGVGLAWYFTKRHYESFLESEIAEAKAFYSKLYKKDEFDTPAGAAEALGVSEAANALASYQGRTQTEDEPAVVVERTVEVETTRVEATNVFDWDQNAEEAARQELAPNEPYIISHDEFMEGEHNYEQVSLSYFAEDDVLADAKDQPIEDIDATVGEGNITRFGHGSGDNRIVYIRNDRMTMDFEVSKSDGSFAQEVLGLRHSDKGPGVRKFRGGDE